MENIIKKIKQDYPVSDQSIDLLVPCLKPHRFPKKYQLIKEGIYCKVAYFIEKGMTRSYWLVDGEEITTSFSCEGNIVFSMDELYYNKLSEEFVESLEDMEVYEISLSHLTHLFRTNIEWQTGEELSIRMNTDACTALIRNGSPCLPKNDMNR